jgi:hypothetical protein
MVALLADEHPVRKMANYARRYSWVESFGRGFDSRHLHKTMDVLLHCVTKKQDVLFGHLVFFIKQLTAVLGAGIAAPANNWATWPDALITLPY